MGSLNKQNPGAVARQRIALYAVPASEVRTTEATEGTEQPVPAARFLSLSAFSVLRGSNLSTMNHGGH